MKTNLLLYSLLLLISPLHSAEEMSDPSAPKEGYTINYNTVPIMEYIRFASKICKVNFIYDEADLNFNVTVVSDEPITAKNVMATLIQVLRIHDLMLLEQDNSLVIHKSVNVRQMATLVTENEKDGTAPIVTRIFRIRNANPDSVATIIRPMISSTALLEVSAETRQLILSDVTANVDKVASLIENLDSPFAILDIKSYDAQHLSTHSLVDLAVQIMSPIAFGNPFLLVPQDLTNKIFIVSTPEMTQKALEVLKTLDTPPKKEITAARKLQNENIIVYKLTSASGENVMKGLKDISKNLQSSGAPDPDLMETIESAKWIRETNSIMLVGSKDSVDKVKEFLSVLDVPNQGPDEKTSFFVYKPQAKTAQETESAILEMVKNLKGTKGADTDFIETVESVKVNPLTQTLVFSGEERYFPQIRDLLSTIDTGRKTGRNNFFLYKIQQADEEQLAKLLNDFSKNLDKSNVSDEGLTEAIQSMKYIKETHSLLFTGPDPALKKLQELVASFDKSSIPANTQFLIYKPINRRGEQLFASLKEVVEYLKSDKFADPALVHDLQSAKWAKSTNSLMFTGDPESLKKIQALLATLDVQGGKPGTERSFFLYPLKYASKESTEAYFNQVAINLGKRNEDELVDTIRSMKWIDQSHSFMFNGTQSSLTQVQELLKNFDTPEAKKAKSGYYIYKLQNTTGDVIEEDLDHLMKNFKASGVKETAILDVIDKIRYVKETNSLLLTGDQTAIDEVKKMIAELDHPRSSIPANSNFLMYKPLHLKAPQIEKSLKDVSNNLKKGNLADPSLLQTIDTAKYVESTNSIVFTGPPDTLLKIQTLLKDIDVAPEKHTPIQHVGETTFLLYKLKHASGSNIVTSIKTMTSNLKKSGTSDKELLSALNSMKYVKDTNSLLFTGTEPALTKVQTLVEQFDVTGLAPKVEAPVAVGPSDFFVYKPVSLPGPDLEKVMQDFAENLKESGLNDPELFTSIGSMRWVEKTQSLIFTGTPKALNQVKDLLKSFDIPTNLPEGPVPGGPLEPTIQAIDNTSFLVYKLQFHKGDEIQGALKQIAKDLILNNAPVNQNLLNSINSIQWLEVTNSILSSGDQETLTRLRELIKNLDVPLKQVFIEMLVVQTSLSNALQFGLEWGANYKYKNKFSGNVFNTFPPASSSSGTTTSSVDQFVSDLANIGGTSATNTTSNPFISATPIPQLIPPGNGFDLGVIGEVIRHQGQSFLSLGSLLQALQQDTETSIIMTPKILTQDGRTSSIFVGENIPFAGSFVSNTQGSSTLQSSNIEYRDIGFNLTVTPVLGNSDIVTLDISLDQTSTVGTISQQTLQSGSVAGIITTKTTMETTVHVPDNNFLVLSGMVNNSKTKANAGLPCLGGLPIIGAAFSTASDTISNSNVVIFLRPHIINSIDDIRKVTTHEEDYFRDQAGSPYLEHNFDDSVELLKTVDDD